MLNKIKKIFKESEIRTIIGFLKNYIPKKKIVVYVPLEYTDKLTFEMGAAGAGLIGNYELCSFRMKGLGTYKPNYKAKPYKGSNNKISFEEEVRLEMECDEEILDSVLDTMLESHPYEEVAYEIYDFKKRSKDFTGYIVNFKKPIRLTKLVSYLQKNLSIEYIKSKKSINKIAVINSVINNNIISKSKTAGCSALLSLNNFSTILKII